MMSKKNRGVAPGSGKTQYNSIEEYHKRGAGRGRWRNGEGGRGLMGLVGSGNPEKGKSFEM